MADHNEITQLLTAAHAERSAEKTKAFYEQALRLCDDWMRSEKTDSPTILKAQIFAQLAYEERTAGARTERWVTALKAMESRLGVNKNSALAEAYALLAVDCFQDSLSSMDLVIKTRSLRLARKAIDEAIDQGPTKQTLALLLARKSSVIRHLSFSAASPRERVSQLQESQRCADLAVRQSEEAGTILELGLAEWALARYQPTDQKYVLKLRRAEECLANPILKDVEIAHLALARLYRLAFKPLDACQEYEQLLHTPKNLRRLLRESYIYGEAATQLWYCDSPREVWEPSVTESRNLLESAVAAGYYNGRLIVGLSYLTAILEGPEAAKTALIDICGERKDLSWDQALKMVVEASPTDLPALGFALGIDQSAVLTRLGSFAWRFLKKEPLAEALYRSAIRLDPHDPIALTNLARFLVRVHGTTSLVEARRLLQKAQNFADRRFKWWRAVLAEIEPAGQEATAPQTGGHRKPSIELRGAVNLKQLKQRFEALEESSDSQQRGYALEVLVFEMAKLTFGIAKGSYRTVRVGGAVSQVDGFFSQRGQSYIVECKWLTKPADHNDVIAFSDKLFTVGVSGLFVSMSGFTEAAISRARELSGSKAILFMDGDEVSAVFGMRLNFDEVMAQKRLYFDQYSDPYHQVRVAHAA